ncbi:MULTISPECIES: YdcH family protein [unclassified Acinetobacter]|uniref:YdcH family protein n=1 Tax=unclassified Acinetobacter TaxID=196816 RepID=UPI001C22B448|nr:MULTISPECIES: YdcH family protein [unclassified Acinetobacter]
MKTKDCNKKIKYMFPEYRDLIIQLREEDPHFAKLFEEHSELDKQITQLELDPVNQINSDIEVIKRKKLKIKDEIYKILTRTAQVGNLS